MISARKKNKGIATVEYAIAASGIVLTALFSFSQLGIAVNNTVITLAAAMQGGGDTGSGDTGGNGNGNGNRNGNGNGNGNGGGNGNGNGNGNGGGNGNGNGNGKK